MVLGGRRLGYPIPKAKVEIPDPKKAGGNSKSQKAESEARRRK
jgi:hypothetical protein